MFQSRSVSGTLAQRSHDPPTTSNNTQQYHPTVSNIQQTPTTSGSIQHPCTKVTRSPGWCGFTSRYSEVGLLDPTDPLFVEIGKALVETMQEEWGVDHYYNGDTFNEMRPSSSDPDSIAAWGKKVYDGMAAADPQAVWFVQGWSLGGWQIPDLQAYFSLIPTGRLQVGAYWKIEAYYAHGSTWKYDTNKTLFQCH